MLLTTVNLLRRWVAPASFALVAFLLVCAVNGALPGMVADLASTISVEGQIRCLSESWLFVVTLSCESLGFPYGFPLLTGGPHIALAAVFTWLPGMGSRGAYTLSSAVVLGLALAGAYALMRRLGAGRLIAVGTGLTYLASPTILALHGFGGTFFGFALLPAYAFVDIFTGDLLKRNSRRAAVVAFAILAMVRPLALFMDGYSFVASALVGGFVWLSWAYNSKNLTAARRWAGPLIFVMGNLGAVLLYRLHAPIDNFQAPLALFRSMGLDVSTLWMPSSSIWILNEVGWTVNHSNLWGDGTNTHNYIGFVCVVLAVLLLVLKPSPARKPAMALAVAGMLSLILSLGPAFKLGEERPPIEGIPTYESYLMPEGTAPELPWGSLFTEIPGVQSMRATYRWFGVTRMAVVVLAGLAVAEMFRRSGTKKWVVVILAVAAVVELAPDVFGRASQYRDRQRQINMVTEQVETKLSEVTKAKQRVFFLNYDGSHNDWLVNYLAPAADLVAYNAGGDKNAALSSVRWPETVKALAESEVTATDLERSLQAGHVDVIIVPFFHLRHSAYFWPPSAEHEQASREAFESILADERFDVETRRWFAAVTLGP